jgi:hypothetical protein
VIVTTNKNVLKGDPMKTKKIIFMIALACFTLFSTSVFCDEGTDRRPPREKWTHETVQAAVESINLENREVILRTPEGDRLWVEVDERVERLNEVKEGDIVSVDYWTYIKAEFREPTPEETKEPLVVIAEAGKAPKDMDPSAAVGAVVKAVVSIEVINRPKMTVAVKGPRGKFVTIPVKDQTLIEQLNVGEVAIVTYAEALALSVEKVK